MGARCWAARNRLEALQEEENEEEVGWIQWCAEEERHRARKGLWWAVVQPSLCVRGDWATEFPIKEVAWNQKMNFRSGMVHHGEKKVCCEFTGLSTPVNMKFQVRDARNPF